MLYARPTWCDGSWASSAALQTVNHVLGCSLSLSLRVVLGLVRQVLVAPALADDTGADQRIDVVVGFA